VDCIADYCGCTALVTIRFMEQGIYNLQVINLGDCRAVLSRKGLAIPLTKDHKPNWPDEKKRIDAVNQKHQKKNEIYNDNGDWRVGDLSVSRSFGDKDNTPQVTHIPDSYCYQLINDDEFIIMACDGVWDVMENHEATNFVRDHKNNNNIKCYNIPRKYPPSGQNTNNISRMLAEFAIAKGSTDNVSVIVIFFEK
jgi:protein phosphatase 2C